MAEKVDPTSSDSSTPSPSLVLARTYEDAMTMLSTTKERVAKIPLNPEYARKATPEQREAARMGCLRTMLNKYIMAQGNDWVAQNKEHILKHLTREEE